ncbi:UDP-glucose 4-epimerase protein [Rhizobium phage RHph_Y1_11]|nr:UDP-glucose 4-epimerase protein [Rhizobium phage RHph_Y1_11]
MKKVLVTGGVGYIGQHVVLALLDHGYEVTIIDKKAAEPGRLTPQALKPAKLIRGDLQDTANMFSLIARNEFDTIIHLAASTSVPESIVNPSLYYVNNILPLLNMLQHCGAYGVRNFIFASSAAVYAKDSEIGREGDTPAPSSPYGVTKAVGEQIIRDIGKQTGLRSAALRFFNVAGNDPEMRVGNTSHDYTSVIRALARAAATGEPFTIYGTGLQMRDYIHVSDVAEAILLTLWHLENSEPKHLTANVCRGMPKTIKDLVRIASDIAPNLKVVFGQERLGDVKSMIGTTPTLHDLGWMQRRNTYSIIKTAIEWERHLLERKA